jgi:hypothetical protein
LSTAGKNSAEQQCRDSEFLDSTENAQCPNLSGSSRTK